jgi:hypothetical protein
MYYICICFLLALLILCLWVQTVNVGANDFTGGVTWIDVPLGSGTLPLIEADMRTRCAQGFTAH